MFLLWTDTAVSPADLGPLPLRLSPRLVTGATSPLPKPHCRGATRLTVRYVDTIPLDCPFGPFYGGPRSVEAAAT